MTGTKQQYDRFSLPNMKKKKKKDLIGNASVKFHQNKATPRKISRV